MSERGLTLADIIRARWLVGPSPKPTFIGPDAAEWLKRDHGVTDEYLWGMRCVVSDAVPVGEAYMILPPEAYGPPRPPIKWIGLQGVVLHNALAVTSCIA